MADDGTPLESINLFERVWKLIDFAFNEDKEEVNEAIVKKYTPSHRSFYPQFAKGLKLSLQGISTAYKTESIKEKITAAVPKTLLMEMAVVAVLTAITFLWNRPIDTMFDDWYLFTLWTRYSSYVSFGTVLALDKKLKQDDEVFLETLKVENQAFGDLVTAVPKKKDMRAKIMKKVKRLVQVLILRFTDTITKNLFPHTIHLGASAMIKLALLRPALGTALASVVSLATFFPTDSYWDEIALILSEVLMDSYEFGVDLIDPYTKRMESAPALYVKKRYHGYLTGMGMIFSLIGRVPILTPACVITGEVGAGKVVSRIVGVNKTQSPKLELLGEKVVTPIEDPDEATVPVEPATTTSATTSTTTSTTTSEITSTTTSAAASTVADPAEKKVQ